MNAPANINKTNTVDEIPLDSIHLDFENSRRKVDPEKYEQLKASIAKSGLLQSLVVSVRTEGGYNLRAGFTRHKILTELGFVNVPVTIVEGTEAELLEAHIAENTVRADLSLVSSVSAVKRLATQCGGDYEEVGRRLGFTTRQLNDRLALSHCSDKVLDALDDEQIKLGHAIILSPFSHTLQDSTLVKIIDEKMSVETLKERAGKARVKLSIAKFDLDGCVGCPHNSNSNTQGMLFDEKVEKDICSNSQCFGEKQTAWLDAEKEKLADEYGTLLDVSTVDNQLLRLIDVTQLGEEQHTACGSCANNVNIIDNRLKSPSLGSVRSKVCNNPTCFDDNVNKYAEQQRQAEQEAKEQKKAGSGKASKKTAESASGKASTPAKSKAEKAKDDYKLEGSLSGAKQRKAANTMFAQAVADSYDEQGSLDRLRLMYLGVLSLMGKLSGQYSISNNKKELEELKEMSKDEIIEAMSDKLHSYMMNDLDNSCETEPNIGCGMGLLHAVGLMRSDLKELAIGAWKPEALEGYPKLAIEAICVESGYAKALDESKGEGSFKALMGQKKPEMLEAILGTDFDWSHYAPAGFINKFIQ